MEISLNHFIQNTFIIFMHEDHVCVCACMRVGTHTCVLLCVCMCVRTCTLK